VNYYYGLPDVEPVEINNSSTYVYGKVPIGTVSKKVDN
jgi:hypothetical protein